MRFVKCIQNSIVTFDMFASLRFRLFSSGKIKSLTKNIIFLYWPAELNGRDVMRPSFNLHTQQGRTEYQVWMADNDVDNEDSELSEHREAQVSAWMNHTYFYNAYVCGGECQFDKSFDRDISQLSSDLWSIRSWRSNPPRWYSER